MGQLLLRAPLALPYDMEFQLRLTNRQKTKWLLLYVLAWIGVSGGMTILLGELLKRVNAIVGAGLMLVALALFVVCYLLLERIQEAIREPVRITVLPDGLVALWEATGTARGWSFSQLVGCRYQPTSRAGPCLRLRLRGGEKVVWATGDRFLKSDNQEAFASMAKAVENAWAKYQDSH